MLGISNAGVATAHNRDHWRANTPADSQRYNQSTNNASSNTAQRSNKPSETTTLAA